MFKNLKQHRQQKGSVLAVAMIFLLVFSVLSIGNMNVAVINERLASNEHEMNLAFQAAESSIAFAQNNNDWINESIRHVGSGVSPTQNRVDIEDAKLSTTVTVTSTPIMDFGFTQDVDAPFELMLFEFNGQASLNSGARSDVALGMLKLIPK